MVVEELVTPLDWERQGMAAGTPFALAHTFAQTGPFRPGNVERRLPGHVLRRLRHGARRGRTHGVDLGQAGRGAGGETTCQVIDTNPLLREGYRRCAQLTWQYGTTYFWGAVLLPRPQRKHVHAVYALCRLADDIVDLPELSPSVTVDRLSAVGRRGCTAFADQFRTALIERGSDDPTMAAIVHTRDHLRHRAGVLRAVLRGDGDGPDPSTRTRPGRTSAATWRARPR